jgi:23S rRNA (uracil1939-C5)-methyltransferase
MELVVEGISKEADGVCREPGGRVVFVPGALPGEKVLARIESERRSFARAELVDVIEAHDDRVEPACAYVVLGCGGCDLQHAGAALQLSLKERIVTEALQRIGGIVDPPVRMVRAPASLGYRTTVRCGVSGGRAGYRRRSSNETLAVQDCLTAHPAIGAVLAEGRFPGASEVQVRVGRSGTLVSVWGSTSGVEVPRGARVASIEDDAWVEKIVAGRAWRVSARSFFQASPEGADLLASTISASIAELAPARSVLVDLYSGVGLMAGSLGDYGRIVAVESSASAVADARVNLSPDVEVVASRVERWEPCSADVVVADPSRRGLGAAGVEVMSRTDAAVAVLVSCDAAAGARDLGLLVEKGYRLESVTVLDLFPQTSHVEMVSALSR